MFNNSSTITFYHPFIYFLHRHILAKTGKYVNYAQGVTVHLH